jgi:hypothetical protein
MVRRVGIGQVASIHTLAVAVVELVVREQQEQLPLLKLH